MIPLHGERQTILVVDRWEPILDSIRNTLGPDFRILVASDGLEGLKKFQMEKPDLVLIDVELPQMDGYETCRLIKTMSGDAFIPVIFIAGKNDLQSKKMGLQSGAVDFLTKPFEPEELLARVQASLRTKKLYGQLMDAYAVIEKEQDTIAGIQRGLLCDRLPEISGFKFFADYQPSAKAGGDYYDFISIDEEHLGVMVADVSGHGTPAAVIMAMLRVLLRSALSKIRSPKQTLEEINRILSNNIESGYFITAFYGVIHLPSKKMKFASAGHPPPIYFENGTHSIRRLSTNQGFPLLVLPENPMEEREIRLAPKSKLVLYTDGLTETKNSQGEMFGIPRLENHLQELGNKLDANELGNELKKRAQEFSHGASFDHDNIRQDLKGLVQSLVHETPFSDDFTLLVVDVESS